MKAAYRGEFIASRARNSLEHTTQWNRVCVSLLKSRPADGENRATIETMFLAIIAMRVLEVLFFVGLVGSSVVVLISFIEDGKELFGEDE